MHRSPWLVVATALLAAGSVNAQVVTLAKAEVEALLVGKKVNYKSVRTGGTVTWEVQPNGVLYGARRWTIAPAGAPRVGPSRTTARCA